MASMLACVFRGAVRGMKITSTNDLWTASGHAGTQGMAALDTLFHVCTCVHAYWCVRVRG